MVSAGEYLAACCRYIDLNPVRAGMVASPDQYRWSSYLGKAVGRKDPDVDFDSSYLAFGRNKKERQDAYAEYVAATIPEGEIKLIRDALQRGQLTGSVRFLKEISNRLGIRIFNQGLGRPKKTKK